MSKKANIWRESRSSNWKGSSKKRGGGWRMVALKMCRS
jgi:hypothetical protein